MKIKQEYAVLMLVEILFEKNLINKVTHDNVKQYYQSQNDGENLHISQTPRY